MGGGVDQLGNFWEGGDERPKKWGGGSKPIAYVCWHEGRGAQCLSRRTISIEILRLQIRFLKSHMTFKGHTGLIGPTGTFSK